MKRKILTLAATFGVVASSWGVAAVTPSATETASPLRAEVGLLLFNRVAQEYEFTRSHFWYEPAQIFTVSVFAAAGGYVGGRVTANPVGLILGTGVGAF